MATVKSARPIEPAPKNAKIDLSVVDKEQGKGKGKEEEVAPKPKRKWIGRALKWLIILLLLGGVAWGGWWAWSYLSKSQPTPASGPRGRSAAAARVAAAPKPPPKPPQFATLEPFTVNLAEEGGDHYLQVALVLQIADENADQTIHQYMPIIRDRILRLLSSMRPSELYRPEDKQKLAERVVGETRASLPGQGDKGVLDVYFAAFVIQ